MYNVCTKVEYNMKYPNKLFQVSLSKNEDASCKYDFCINASFHFIMMHSITLLN